MALPQVGAVQLAFGGGIDESTRPELLEPGSAWKTLENIRQDQRGGASKRFGYASMTNVQYGATTRSAGFAMFLAGLVPCVITGTHCDAYDAKANAWKTLGRVPEADFDLTPLPTAGMSLGAVEVASANGYLAVAYRGQVGNATTSTQYAFAAVMNATTGAVVRIPEQMGSVTSPGFMLVNVASYSDRYFVLFVSDGSGGAGGEIAAYYLDTNTATTISAGWQFIGTVTSAWDDGSTPAVTSLSNRVAIAYGSTTATTLVVKTYTIAGNTETRNITTGADPVVIAMAGSIADTLWVSWNETTAVKVIGLDADSLASTLATVATITTTSTACEGIFLAHNTTTAGKGRLYVLDGSTSYMRGFTTSAGAAATDGAQITFLSSFMLGRPAMYSGRYYAHFRTSADSNAVLCDWSEDLSYVRPVANVAPGLVSASDAFGIVGGGLDIVASTKVYALLNVKKSAAAFSPTLVTYDFASTTRWHSVAHNGTVMVGGGLLAHFDGKRIAEVGFLSRPTTPTTSLGGTGFTSANGVRYVAVYEEIDGAGNWCVSAISDPSASTGAVANNTVTVSTTPLTMSARLATTDAVTGTRVVWYRTLDGGLPPYYRVGESYNTTTAAVTLADTMSNATLATKAKLYAANLPSTVGEKFARIAPTGLRHVVSCNGVLVGARGSVLHHSGQPVDGEETWFSPNFQAPIEGDGEITALGAQDGVVYVFKRRAIYAVQAEPPADNGTSGGLGAPRRLAVDVGCIDARSIVVTNLGLFFQSERGLELLTRAQSVEWVGEKVQQTLASFPYVTSACVDASQSVVYFELAATLTTGVYSSGRTLVFDLSLGTWISVDRRSDASGTADTAAQASCITWTGTAYKYAWLQSNGTVRYETTSYLDEGDSANAWITMRAETPKMRPAGIQSNHRLISGVLLAERHTNHQVTINVAYDDSSSWTDTETWTAVETAALTREQMEIGCSREQIMSVQFRIEDLVPSNTTATPVTTGKGATWVGLALNIGTNNTRQATTLLPAEHRK